MLTTALMLSPLAVGANEIAQAEIVFDEVFLAAFDDTCDPVISVAGPTESGCILYGSRSNGEEAELLLMTVIPASAIIGSGQPDPEDEAVEVDGILIGPAGASPVTALLIPADYVAQEWAAVVTPMGVSFLDRFKSRARTKNNGPQLSEAGLGEPHVR